MPALALRLVLDALAAQSRAAARQKAGSEDRSKSWAPLIDDLIRQRETRRSGWTAARKRESLQRALENGARNPVALPARMRVLVENRQRSESRPTVVVEIAEQAELVGQHAAEALSELRAALVHALETTAPAHQSDAPALAETSRHLAVRVRGARDLDNVRAQRSELMHKQSLLKQSLDEARETLKTPVKTLVDQPGSLSESAGDICVRLDRYTGRISTAQEVPELNDVIAESIDDTRAIQSTTKHTRHELTVARNRVGIAELRIAQMERELETKTERAREDTLTGALNRRGLNEAFEREAHCSDRADVPMCIALLIVDNFKQLNDRLGHQAGDAASLHLVEVIKACLRDPDVVARYGGEEFVVLLPETDSPQGVVVMTRLQRELTKRFFLHNQERLLITFSCRVAQRKPSEAMENVLTRADCALYKAKQAGKNRVLMAEAA